MSRAKSRGSFPDNFVKDFLACIREVGRMDEIARLDQEIKEIELASLTFQVLIGALAFREETADVTGWTVVDFKTDREFGLHRAEYTAQVALYAEAIEKATNSSARGILLVI